VDIRTFVTNWYPHGLPCPEAHAYGPGAVPDLAAMLGDPSLEAHWVNVVAALGCIRDATAVQPLMDFMKRQQGPVSVEVFRAVLGVLPAVGQIASGGDPAAIQIITDFVDSGAVRRYGVGLVYGRYHDDALAEVLGRMAINGLGVSGRPEALAHLKRLSGDPALRKDWLDNVSEAISLNERVMRLGPAKAFGEER
jgi:HEAT repeat protein